MKKKISIYEAQKKLMASLNKKDFGDRVYEFAQEQFQNAIAVINDGNDIMDADGNVLTDDEKDGWEWYDDVQELFFQKVYDRTLDFLQNGE